VAKFTTLTLLLLLISCKRSFPIVGLKMLSLLTLALISHKKIFVWDLGSLSNIHSILIEAVFHVINFFLCWGMNTPLSTKLGIKFCRQVAVAKSV
jgi:hypothetical protein